MTAKIVAAALAAGLVGGAAADQAARWAFPPRSESRVIAVSGPASETRAARVARFSYGELEQREVDAITAGLKDKPKESVMILCAHDERCGDVALNLDNAFESAKWQSRIVAPQFPPNAEPGVTTNDPTIAVVLAAASRIKPRLIDKAATNEPTYVMFGDKGRSSR